MIENDTNFAEKVLNIVRDYLKSSAFHDRKLTDTPTDRLQVANKGYVDDHGGGGTPAGNNTDIQFNDGGAFGGDDNLQWDKNFQALILSNGSTITVPDSSQPLYINLNDLIVADGNAASLYLTSGTSQTNGNGGDLIFNSGAGGIASGNGGTVSMTAQNAGGTGTGGPINLTAGDGGATSGDGGAISITSGYGIAGNSVGGQIDIIPGDGHGSANAGSLYLRGGLKGASSNDGNVITGGTRSNPGVITPNSANGGFLVVPTLSGAPTGSPSSGGSMCFDVTNNKLYIWNSLAWKSVTLT